MVNKNNMLTIVRKLNCFLLIVMPVIFTVVFNNIQLHADNNMPPQNLQVPTLAYDESKIVLIWEKPNNYQTNPPIDYEVYKDGIFIGTSRQNFEDNYIYIDTFMKAFYNGTSSEHYIIDIQSYTVTGLEPDTEYSFYVKAKYEDGFLSTASETITQRTTKIPTVIDVTEYGAVGSRVKNVTPGGGGEVDFIKANTQAIQAAIDATPPGGKIILPGSGDNSKPIYYISGSLFLHSDMTFEIQKGATLLGSPNFDDYPRSLLVYPYSQDIRTYGLLNAVTWDTYTLKNIRVVGEGSIDGNGWQYANEENPYQLKEDIDPIQNNFPLGDSKKILDPTGNGWRLPNYFAGNNNNVIEKGILAADAFAKSEADQTPNSGRSQWYNARPNLTVFRGVDGVYYEGLTFYNAPFHGIVNYHSKNIVSNGTIVLTYNNNNGDGIEFGDCHDFIIFNNFYDTGDDSINFAAGQGAVVRNTTNEPATGNGRIFNNFVRNGHGGLVAAGSHTGGVIGNILAEDNVYNSSEPGNNGILRLKSSAPTGGGVRNIEVRDTAVHYSNIGGGATVVVDTSYSDSNASTSFSPESEVPLIFEDIAFRNITISNSSRNLMEINEPASAIVSQEPILRNFLFENINIIGNEDGGNLVISNLHNSTFRNINRDIIMNENLTNITIENCGTTPNQMGAKFEWNGALDFNIVGNSIELSWQEPIITPYEEVIIYAIMVDDGNGFAERMEVEQTNANINLAAFAAYDIGIIAKTQNNVSDVALVTSIITSGNNNFLTAPELPEDITVTLRGESGISWQSLEWNRAHDVEGIHYYQIIATPQNGNEGVKVFRDYYDKHEYQGYALWGLEDGITYDVILTAVNWVGIHSKQYDAVTFTTVPGTLTDIPQWKEDSVLRVSKEGQNIILSWNANDVTSFSNGDTSKFAGYRILVNGVLQQPVGGGATQVNAVPTTTETTYTLNVSELGFLPDTEYKISVEAGEEILKYASGSGGLKGSTVFTGTNNIKEARNQVTFGKWTGHGPSVNFVYSITD